MKRITSLFALVAAGALIFTQIGCSDAAASSANNSAGVDKKAVTDKNKKLKTPDYMRPD